VWEKVELKKILKKREASTVNSTGRVMKKIIYKPIIG